uniref:Methyl-CpG binding protein 2/3 C-terminal domain-containing protein n=1 Tax=Panagrolaimus sp. ES5 TaxID=591445 RepID=A0AC34FW16_9BILA
MGRIKSEAGVGGVRRGPKSKAKSDIVKTGFDGSIENPWRRTATIFKQPITIVHSTRKGTTEAPLDKIKKISTLSNDRPLPLFWAKAFEKSSAMIPIHKCDKTSKEFVERSDEYVRVKANLPENVTPYCNVLGSEDSLISYISALTPSAVTTNGIVGQKEHNPSKKYYDNPFFNANPEQPLVVGITKILDTDVSKQEQKVLDARKRLQQLRDSFTFRPSTTA